MPGGRLPGAQPLSIVSSLNTLPFPEGSNTDRPDASAVYLHDFQRFLLHEQQVRAGQGWGSWRSCLGRVLIFSPPCTSDTLVLPSDAALVS